MAAASFLGALFFVTQTAAWTIDLPEVRRYYFSKNYAEDFEGYRYYANDEQTVHLPKLNAYKNSLTHKKNGDENLESKELNFNQQSNRYGLENKQGYLNFDGRSQVNEVKPETYENYAHEYEYQTYMEKKVHEVVRSGSSYLEGLRRSLLEYTQRLEGCPDSKLSEVLKLSSPWRPQIELNQTGNVSDQPNTENQQLNFVGQPSNPSGLPAIPNGQPLNTGSQPLNTNGQPLNPNGQLLNTGVQPLNTNGQPLNPNGQPLNTGGQLLNTSSPNISQQLNQTFNTSELLANARVRCAEATKAREHVRRIAELAMWAIRELQELDYSSKYRHREDDDTEEKVLLLKLAWFLDRLAHLTGFKPTVTPVYEYGNIAFRGNETTNGNPDVVSMLGITTSTVPPPTELSPIYPVEYPYGRKRSKRSIQNPLLELIQYYTKYKIWVNSNIEKDFSNKEYEDNRLKEISERTFSSETPNRLFFERQIDEKPSNTPVWKRSIPSILIKPTIPDFQRPTTVAIPENPYLDLSYIVKHKPGVRYVKDKLQAEEISWLVKKIRKSPLKSTKEMSKLEKKLRSTRSIKYERPILGRYPLDPTMDISYYVKNKPGRNYNYDPVQAAQIRAGLRQIFDNGNIFVIERYGSNYNGNPAVAMNGLLRSEADV